MKDEILTSSGKRHRTPLNDELKNAVILRLRFLRARGSYTGFSPSSHPSPIKGEGMNSFSFAPGGKTIFFFFSSLLVGRGISERVIYFHPQLAL